MKSPLISATSLLRSILAMAAFAALAPTARPQEPRLANISARALSGTGPSVLTLGFVIGPGPNKPVLIRAVGPTLSGFGVAGALADPVLTVFNSANAIIATNDNWATPLGSNGTSAAELSAAFARVGAFALTATSRDSAVIVTLPPGNYTAQVAGTGTSTGVALAEVYEIGNTGAKLLNTSTRLTISAASSPIIGMVVAPGTGTRKLLIRTAGPALGAFGLTGTLADPAIRITNSLGTSLASNDNWGTPSDTRAADTLGLTNAFGIAGAFTFPAGSKDSAVLLDLAPGNYGIQVSGHDGGGVVQHLRPAEQAGGVGPAGREGQAGRGRFNRGEPRVLDQPSGPDIPGIAAQQNARTGVQGSECVGLGGHGSASFWSGSRSGDESTLRLRCGKPRLQAK